MTDTNSWNWYGNSGAMPIKSKYLSAPAAQPDVPPVAGGATTDPSTAGTGATTDPNAGATGGGTQTADPTRLAAFAAGRVAALPLAIAGDTKAAQEAAFVAAWLAVYTSAGITASSSTAEIDYEAWDQTSYVDVQAANAAAANAAAAQQGQGANAGGV